MSWVLMRLHKNGTRRFYIRDIRDGRQVVISTPEGTTADAAEQLRQQYDARRDLEKHGYDDQFAAPLTEEKPNGMA